MGKKIKKALNINRLATLFIVVWILLSFTPIYYVIITSFKTMEEVYSSVSWIPGNPTYTAYVEVLTRRPFGYYIRNSLIVSLSTTGICLVFSTLGAYSYSRFRYKGKNLSYLMLLGSRLAPPAALMIPLFNIATSLDLVDTLQMLTWACLFMNIPFVTWMMKGFFDAIPRDLDDAAKVDGCTNMQSFLKIILPIASPGVAAAAIITFLSTWNEFTLVVTLSSSVASKTITIGCSEFVGDVSYEWNQMSAGSVISMIPALIFILLFQKYLIKGLQRGAIKG